jgi:hypothetical protein
VGAWGFLLFGVASSVKTAPFIIICGLAGDVTVCCGMLKRDEIFCYCEEWYNTGRLKITICE